MTRPNRCQAGPDCLQSRSMMHRVWAAVRRAARWYALGFGAAVASLGNAELALAHLHHPDDVHDVGSYARAGVVELEAWLGRFTVND